MRAQKSLLAALIAAGIISLAACGGGGGSSSTSAGAGAIVGTNTAQISGTAATGAPFAGATVTLIDANGVRKTATTDPDGAYSFDATGLSAPFALKATAIVGGATANYVAVTAAPVNPGSTMTLNVTPLTTAVAALLSDNIDPLDMTDVVKLKAKATPAEIKKVVHAIKTVLANVVAATGADAAAFDPMATAFKADRTGLDSVLDAIKVTLSSQGVVLTNAFAPIAESASDLAAPSTPSVMLTQANLSAPPAPLAAPSVSASTIATILDKWRDQLDACFALPSTDRVLKDANGYVTALNGACAQMNGFDASYKTNGYTLLQIYGRVLTEPLLDNAKFGIPEILTLLKTEAGDNLAFFRLPFKLSDGGSGFVFDVAKKVTEATTTDSGWRVVGNQQDYDVFVEARNSRGIDMKNGGKTSYSSAIRLFFNPLGPNASDVARVKITGPGLPAEGVVLGKSDVCGTSGYLAIFNKTGELGSTTTGTTASDFVFDIAYADGSTFTWPTSNINVASAPVDVTALKPFARYKVEVYRSATDKKTEFYTRLPVAPVAATYASTLQWNELGTAAKRYLDPNAIVWAAGQATVTIDWTRNPLATPVDVASMYGYEYATGTRAIAQAAGIGQSSTSVTANVQDLLSADGKTVCSGINIPTLNISGNYREIALGSRTHSGIRQFTTWYYRYD